jgi:tRNA threonylcarbamoyl adenosine modification protein YeaZ
MIEFQKRLAIDCSTPICTVALKNGDAFYTRWTKGVGVHSESTFLFTKAVLEEANLSFDEINEILITTGPGSYTGLRIAASAVKGLLFGTDIPLIGVQTLAFFAFAAFSIQPDLTRFHAIIDARRTHLYHQIFEKKSNKITAVNEMEIRELSEIESLLQSGDSVGGTGSNRLNLQALNFPVHVFEEEDLIRAEFLAQISDSSFESDVFISRLNPAFFEPNYYTSGYAQVHQPKL